MGHNGDGRRQRRGSAWHWRQTDCWYYTQPGTKKRVPLVDDDGKRIRGKDNPKAADVALARVKLAGQWRPTPEPAKRGEWLVARVCSEYLGYCEQGAAAGTISSGHCDEARRYLNSLCEYCGALPVSQLKKGHVNEWIDSHPTWRSPATQRNAITIVLAAFNHAREMHDVPNPLRGLKKAYQRRHRKQRRQKARSKRTNEPDLLKSFVAKAEAISRQAEAIVDVAAFASKNAADELLPVLTEAIRRPEKLRDYLTQADQS